MIRAAVACAGHWYVAGAILSPADTTAPALWASSDGTSFTALPIRPRSAYGPSNVLYGVACRGADVVAVGANTGGAHGNPRTSTWLSTGGGPLTEVPAAFETYGGPDAVGVGQVAGGPAGFLIVGARINARGGLGAAVWQSPDGRAFTLVDSDPALESDARGTTEVHDATVLAGGYLAVGGITPPHSHLAARDPLAWRSTDGRTWQRVEFPATEPDDLLQSVTPLGDGLLAAGTDGTGFAVWSGDATGSTWRHVAHFGVTGASTSVPDVVALIAVSQTTAVLADTAYAVVSDGTQYQLWRGGLGPAWQRVGLPETVPAAPVVAGPRVVCAAAAGGQLMIAADDGTAAHVWFASTT